jgi:hypothetical protein
MRPEAGSSRLSSQSSSGRLDAAAPPPGTLAPTGPRSVGSRRHARTLGETGCIMAGLRAMAAVFREPRMRPAQVRATATRYEDRASNSHLYRSVSYLSP